MYTVAENMEQRKRREAGFKIKIFCFVAGALAVAVSIAEIIYRSPMGFFGARGTAKMLALGLIFMLAPIWSYFRQKSRRR